MVGEGTEDGWARGRKVVHIRPYALCCTGSVRGTCNMHVHACMCMCMCMCMCLCICACACACACACSVLHGVRGDFPTGEAGARGAFPPKVWVFSGCAGRDPHPKYSITTCYFVAEVLSLSLSFCGRRPWLFSPSRPPPWPLSGLLGIVRTGWGSNCRRPGESKTNKLQTQKERGRTYKSVHPIFRTTPLIISLPRLRLSEAKG